MNQENNNFSIPKLSVTRPVTILMVFSILVIWGLVSYTKIPVELKPNASFNNISVIVNVRGGMPPSEVEKLITIPIEDAMSTTAKLKTIQSTSKEGRATIVLSFPAGTDMDLVSLDVSERYERIKNDLPKEVERPVIAKYEQNDIPVIILALSSKNKSVEELREEVELKIKPTLQRIKGIANVEISGGRERKIVVEVDEEKLLARDLSIDQVTESISKNNLNMVAGDVKSSDMVFLIRSEAQYSDLEEVRDTIILSKNYGGIIKVRDVASVNYQYMESKSFSRINAEPVVSVYLQKESEANTVSVCKKVVKEVSRLKKEVSKDTLIKIIDNQAVFINEVIEKVQSALIMGGILAIIILYVFLGDIYSTFIIGVSIPLCVVISIGLMYWYDISINVMTLSGLALGIGMLVDNSIVVLENISKKIEEGKQRIKAVIEGTSEIFLALIASTLSTLVVFLPIVFVNPQTKIMYGGMALTIAFSLISSLFVSISLVPALFSLGKGRTKKRTFFKTISSKYQVVIVGALRNRYFLLGAAIILFIGSLIHFLYMDKDIYGGADEAKFIVFVELQSGAKVSVSDVVVKEVEDILKEIPEIKSYSSRVENWSSKVYVKLKKNINKSTMQVIEDVREKIKNIGNKEKAFVYTSSGKSVGGTEVQLNIFGYDYKELLDISSKISKAVKELGGFFDFKLRYKPGRPEMVLGIKKARAAMLGFTVKEISDAIHAQVRGVRATKIFQNGKEVETIIRLKEKDRRSLKEVLKLHIVNKFGNKVPLSELASFNEGFAPSEIWHKDKVRMIQVSFSTTNYSLVEAINIVGKKIKESVKIPSDYNIQFGGDYKEMRKTFLNLQIAFLVMLLLVFMLLASLFESYIQPFIIMASVPLALIGVSMFLGFFGSTLTIGVIMGIIMLGGIVVNNAIVLIDHFNHLKTKKMDEMRCLIKAGKSRLRPILMTTLTTVFGLIPLAFDKSSASSLWAPLGITVIGGLLISTVLTLIIIPSLTLIIKDLKEASKIFI